MNKQECIDIINIALLLHSKHLPDVTINDMAAALADASHQESPAIIHDGIEFHELRPTRSVGLWGRLRSFEGDP